jgi:SulP family sulfate permease
VRFLIIDFRRVTGVDSSAVVSFIRLGQLASRHGFTLVITGINDHVAGALMRGGLQPGPTLRIDSEIDQALVWCENQLLARLAPDVEIGSPRGVAEVAFGLVKDAALAAKLARYFEPVELAVGDLLIEDGTPSDEMYFVGAGRGAVFIRASDKPVRVATIGPGAIVGEIAFYLGQPRNASIVVEAPMTAWRFSRASLARLQQENPDLAFRFHDAIAAMMAARLTSTDRLVAFLSD